MLKGFFYLVHTMQVIRNTWQLVELHHQAHIIAKICSVSKEECSTVSTTDFHLQLKAHTHTHTMYSHSHKVAGEREGLLAEREELDREVRSLGLATTQLETDITRLQSDIVIIGQ